MNREKIQQILILVIGCAGIVYGSYALIIKSKFKKIKEISTKSKTVSTDLGKAKKEVKSLTKIKAKVKNLDAEVTRHERELISEDSFEFFLGIIKKLADSENIALQKSTLLDSVNTLPANEVYAERWVSVETSAPYHAIGKLIAKLENYSPFIRIVELNIVSSGSTIKTHNVIITVGFLVKKNKRNA